MVSVIVPVYNGQDYLKKCVDSIEGQTYGNLEVIIVDDGSTDKTGQVCERLTREYGNVKVLRTGDEGVSAARNAGLDVMQGEFVTFVDADDRLLPDMVQVLYDCIVETGSDVAGCGFFAWRQEEEIGNLGGKNAEKNLRVYSSGEFLMDGILGGNSRCWSKLYRSDVVGELRFRKGISIGEDMLFLVDLLPKAGKVAEISYQGYGYFQNPTGAMNRRFLPRYMDQILCWEIAREEVGRLKTEGMAGTPREKEELHGQVTALLMIGIMLTVGKLALLPAKDRKQFEEYIRICHEKMKREMRVTGAYEALPLGYRVKAKIFAMMPEIYLGLYHFWKGKG